MQKDKFTRDIIHYAFRYALGRSSYAPSLVCDWIREHIHLITNSDAKQMRDEIEDYYDRYKTLAYKQCWQDLIAYFMEYEWGEDDEV